MDSLEETLKQTMLWYAADNDNIKMSFLSNETEHTHGVILITTPIHERSPMIAVLARVADNKIIIEEDNTDRPLYQALMDAGISRNQIILAYVNEPIPTPHTD
jgi:hypothetical protein